MRRMNDEIRSELHRMMQLQGFPSQEIREMVGGYELKNNQRGVLSLTQHNYTFSGGAHGNTLLSGSTFDVNTGQLVPLAGLFTKGSRYVERINQLIKQQIEQRQLPLLDPFTTIAPDQTYYLADKSIVIFFQLYELLPYVYGFPYFPISVYELQDIVDENGVWGRMIG